MCDILGTFHPDVRVSTVAETPSMVTLRHQLVGVRNRFENPSAMRKSRDAHDKLKATGLRIPESFPLHTRPARTVESLLVSAIPKFNEEVIALAALRLHLSHFTKSIRGSWHSPGKLYASDVLLEYYNYEHTGEYAPPVRTFDASVPQYCHMTASICHDKKYRAIIREMGSDPMEEKLTMAEHRSFEAMKGAAAMGTVVEWGATHLRSREQMELYADMVGISAHQKLKFIALLKSREKRGMMETYITPNPIVCYANTTLQRSRLYANLVGIRRLRKSVDTHLSQMLAVATRGVCGHVRYRHRELSSVITAVTGNLVRREKL
jgi:hypothetical protein